MGISLGGGQSSSSGRSATTETTLSKKQADILAQREDQYQALFFPALAEELRQAQKVSVDPGVAEPLAQGVNQSFSSSQNSFKQAMAQRGLQGSGMETAGLAGMATARGQALSGAFQQAQQAQQQKKLQLLQMGGSWSPAPTTAAPMGQVSSNKASAWNMQGAAQS